MKNYANKYIQEMKPYSPPLDLRRAYNGSHLDFNERTIPIDRNVRDVLTKFVSNEPVQMYPEYFDVCKKIASYAGVSPDQILLTNGSDQGMDLIFRTFTQALDKVIIPAPSFAMFFQCAEVTSNVVLDPTYNKELGYPTEEVLELLEKEEIKLLVICNPNNPTGTLVDIGTVEKITKKAFENGTVVYIDEAYVEFSKTTATPLLKKYPNLIITRTFSKAFGLASLRIGYIIASKMMIEELKKVRGPYDINMIGCYAAAAALDNLENTEQYINEIMTEAKPMVEIFFRKNNIPFWPSAANILLFKPKNAKQTFEIMKKNGVMLRPRKGSNIEGTIRVSIGTILQMKKFIDIYETKILS